MIDIEHLDKSKQLVDVNFEAEGCHLAVVHKVQGGAANGYHSALITKSTDDISKMEMLDVVKQAAEVSVVMSMEDFLKRFFNMYYDEAAMLAKLLGYESSIDDEPEYETYNDYLESKLENISILKALHHGEDFYKLPFETQVGVLKSQEQFEKAIAQSKQNDKQEGVIVSDNTNDTAVELEDLKKSLETLQADLQAERDLRKALEQEKADAALEAVIEKASGVALEDEQKEELKEILKAVDLDVAEKLVGIIEKAAKKEDKADEEMFKKSSVTGESDVSDDFREKVRSNLKK